MSQYFEMGDRALRNPESADFTRDRACQDGRARPHTPARDEWASALRRDAHEMVRSMAC